MNIKVPLILKDKIKSEGEAMVIAFLLMVSEDHGFNDYNFNSHDVRKLYGITYGNCLLNSAPMLENLRSMINIMAIDEFNWLLSFKDYDANDSRWRAQRGKKGMRYADYKLERGMHVALWCFALGRYSAQNSVIEEGDVFFHKDDDSSIGHYWNNFKPNTIK